MTEQDVQRLQLAANPRRASSGDADRLAKLFAAAFHNDPVMDWVARPGPDRAAALQTYFFRFLDQYMIPRGEVWMSDDGATAAIWVPPGIVAWPTGLGVLLQQLQIFFGLCGLGRMVRGGAIWSAMKKAHPREPHFYLFFMAVDPHLQGKGLGSTLLDANLKRIDAVKSSAYLENSNPKNTRLYERAGFVAHQDLAPKGVPPLIPMWRPAR